MYNINKMSTEQLEKMNEQNINIVKRNNKKTIELNDPTQDDLNKLIVKEKLRKEKANKYNNENRGKKLEYLREYAKTHRDTEKEKSYYLENKAKIAIKTKMNLKKYMEFYSMYKDKHPEFYSEWDTKRTELINALKKERENIPEKDLEKE